MINKISIEEKAYPPYTPDQYINLAHNIRKNPHNDFL